MRTLSFVKEHHDSWQRELGTVGFPSSQGGPRSLLCPLRLGPRLPIRGKGPESKTSGVNVTSMCVWRKDVAHMGHVTRNPW